MQIAQIAARARQEAGAWRRASAEHGRRRATMARARELAGIDDLAGQVAGLTAQVDALGHTLDVVGGQAAAALVAVQAAERRADLHQRQIEDAHRMGELASRIVATSLLVEQTRLDDPPLITVITPTHDRRALLERAVASVRAQRYARWEMVIALDGCADDTDAYVRGLAAGDARFRFVLAEGGRPGRARNRALAVASGEVIAYLDDDNQLAEGWLASVAWAMRTYPDVSVLYGVQVTDRPGALRTPAPPRSLPCLDQARFVREHLRVDNLADMSAIAPRAGQPEAIFDERLRRFGDWDLFGRLAAAYDPLGLPALSGIYRSDSPDRLSLGPAAECDAALIRETIGGLLDARGLPERGLEERAAG